MKSFLLDVLHAQVKEVEVRNDCLEDLYKLICCDTIDIVTRKIGERAYDIVCDDEALIKADPIPSAIDERDKPCLFGNLLICNHKGGSLTDLTDEDIEYIKEKVIGILYDSTRGKGIDLGVALRPVTYLV